MVYRIVHQHFFLSCFTKGRLTGKEISKFYAYAPNISSGSFKFTYCCKPLEAEISRYADTHKLLSLKGRLFNDRTFRKMEDYNYRENHGQNCERGLNEMHEAQIVVMMDR